MGSDLRVRLFPRNVVDMFGEINGGPPLYFFAAWAPAISGILLVLAYGGFNEFRIFLSRLFLRRCGAVWWLFILIGIPLVYMAGALIGLIWVFWHLPAFYLSGVFFAEWGFPAIFIGNATLAILGSLIFNSARGQPALANAVSLVGGQSILARRTALRHVDTGCGCFRNHVAEA